MIIYIPSWLLWYIAGIATPFALVILWMVAVKITGKGKPEDENSMHK